MVPSPWSLLEAVQGALQETDIVRVSRVDEAGRLLTVDGLLQVAVKKHILHVKLMNGPAAGGGDA